MPSSKAIRRSNEAKIMEMEDGSCQDENYYAGLTVAKLREELKRRGLRVKGTKKVLISRLRHSDREMHTSQTLSRKKGNSSTLNGSGAQQNGELEQRVAMSKDRASLVLWKRPFQTVYYFILETLVLTHNFITKLWRNKYLVALAVILSLILYTIYHTEGSHQQYVLVFRKQFLWCAYWLGLGILSSVGLGTGLHTFLLYLGPHIAAVTLAAFECVSVDFPEPPYPDDIICPEQEGTSISIFTIMSKVRLEAFMWGAGTAIGELPPYFMARAARLSGEMDEDEAELEELIHDKETHSKELSILDRGKIAVHDLVQRVGFIGILLCASIPNPLFDLAGITCGHFLIPFWTFFGATLIGKAVIKMHIQKLFVIFMFSEHHVEYAVKSIKYIPYFGPSLQAPFKEYLHKQKEKLHVKPGTSRHTGSQSWLSWVFEKLVLVMVVFFVVSIINSMAQRYHKRLTDEKKENKE